MAVRGLLFVFISGIGLRLSFCQPGPVMGAAGAGGGPPPGRGFQLPCTDVLAYADQTDPAIIAQFTQNAPPGYDVVSVEPSIYPGKNAHRFIVKYRSHGPRRCEDIRGVCNEMNNYKPQNSVVGTIAVVPGGYLVEYKKYCVCYRRSYRRRRSVSRWRNSTLSWDDAFAPRGYYISAPQHGSGGTMRRCDDRDPSCGHQNF